LPKRFISGERTGNYNMKKCKTGEGLRILVIGAGMYVEYGTVMPALNELYRAGLVDTVSAAATSVSTIAELKKRMRRLRKMTGTDMEIAGFPQKGHDPLAYRKALSLERPDCAIVVVPDHLHYRIARDLINAGVHTLVVKPLCASVNEAKMLASLARNRSVYGAVEFHKRYDEANLKLKDIVGDGRLGDILYISVEYSQRRTVPIKAFRRWVGHTNIFQYLGVHYADIIYFATGARPVRALATGQKALLKRSGIDTYDSIQAVIEWSGPKGKKFISTILTNWIDPDTTSSMSDQKIKVIGTEGRYESDQKDRSVQIVTEKGGIEDVNPYFTKSYPLCGTGFKYFKGYGIESIRQFCEDALSIKSGASEPPDFAGKRPTFRDALVSTAIVEAVNLSLKKGSLWVKVRV